MATPELPDDWGDETKEWWLQWAQHPKVLLPFALCENSECVGSFPCAKRLEAQRKLESMGVEPYRLMVDYKLTSKRFW
jgi:hypothetical protein